MKKTIIRLWESYKNRQRQQKQQEEKNAFNITERNGVIYIMAGMRAIKAIEEEAKASEIIFMLDECRKAQLKYQQK